MSAAARMWVLALGECDGARKTVAPGVADQSRVRLPVSAYLVRLADGSLLLVDTGMHRGHVADPDLAWRGHSSMGQLRAVMSASDTLTCRLNELGYTPGDISYVVNTHLHFDHAGNNDLFGGARFFVQRAHWEFARGNRNYPGFCWDLPQLRYDLLDGPAQVVPGVQVLPTPGHTPGHQSVVVTLAEAGTVILAGDAVHSGSSFEQDNWAAHHDPIAARRSAHTLRALARSKDAVLIYGHDRQAPQPVRIAPDSYC